MSDNESRRSAGTDLLTDLVTNHLDGGYRAAAERRGGSAARHWYDRPLVALGCLLAGFVCVIAYVHTHRGAPEAAKVHQQLVNRVRSAEQDTDRLAAQVNQVQRQVAAEQAAALPRSDTLGRQVHIAQTAAGEIAVHGPGITVTLIDPPTPTTTPSARAGSTPISAADVLTDQDVRSVANELWRDGAQAMAVNGVRLTPTSAIRFAGEAVLVDFQPITSPYRISAIGNADDLATSFAQSSVASRYQTLVSADHIGFTTTEHDRLDLPAAAPVSIRYASPGSSAAPSARPSAPSRRKKEHT